MSDYGPDDPPPKALGDDRPSDNDDHLDDTANEFAEPPSARPVLDGADDSDDESLLSEVDEAQFADFDATAVQVAPDLETLSKHIKASKRKRAEGDEVPKKRKEGRREKPKKSRRRADSDDGFSGGEEIEGKRARKSKGVDGTSKERKRRAPVQEDINEEHLTPEERRRRALDRAMDAALKRPSARRMRKGDIDLESSAEEEINDIRGRMIKAAEADAAAHDHGQPAFHKIKMLPEVTAILNRNTHMQALVDPDINLLEAVRFFLEPLNDGALPAYNIQRDLFAAISKLPINKESLIASGIGKVTLFYTKSKKVEIHIKRQAEKLIQEWTRPMLQKSDDHTKKVYQKVAYDPQKKTVTAPDLMQRVKHIAPGEKKSNRAKVFKSTTGYTIVPESQILLPNR